MEQPFFPDPVFAWVFIAALVAVTAAAAVIDLRTLTIPKWLTFTTLGLGVLFTVARMAWLGANHPEGFHPFPDSFWYFNDMWTGAGVGLLSSLAGILFGFGLFFLMWILGACGGGDVKLFAALGAWGGVVLTLYLLIGTILFVVLLAVGRFVLTAFNRGAKSAFKDYSLKGAAAHGKRSGGQGAGDYKRPRRRLTAYSLAVALSAVVLCLFLLYHDRARLFGAANPASALTGPEAAARVCLRGEKP
jgi:Flp pilus assembly protein protease CpaA